MIIYKITNSIDGKVYIGQTRYTTAIRWSQHKHNAILGKGNTYLSKAIRKYGPENFKIEVIDTANSREELSQKELFYINELRKTNSLYNLTSRVSVTARVWTEHEKKTRYKPAKPQPIRCLNTGEIFESIRKTAQSVGRSESLISSIVNGRKDSANGLVFEYVDQAKKEKADKVRESRIMSHKTKFFRGRAVVCEQTGQVFKSIKEAARWVGVAENNLYKHLKREFKTCKTLIFSYVS